MTARLRSSPIRARGSCAPRARTSRRPGSVSCRASATGRRRRAQYRVDCDARRGGRHVHRHGQHEDAGAGGRRPAGAGRAPRSTCRATACCAGSPRRRGRGMRARSTSRRRWACGCSGRRAGGASTSSCPSTAGPWRRWRGRRRDGRGRRDPAEVDQDARGRGAREAGVARSATAGWRRRATWAAAGRSVSSCSSRRTSCSTSSRTARPSARASSTSGRRRAASGCARPRMRVALCVRVL